MASKGGKTTKRNKSQPVVYDETKYGKARAFDANVYQLFWDNPQVDSYTGNPIGIDGPLYGGNTWDRVMLNGTFLPGIWDVTATPSIQLDVQKPQGFDGAALVSRGYVPAGITLTGKLWHPEQWAEWQRILPTFWAVPHHVAVQDAKGKNGQRAGIQGAQRAVKVDHPGLAAMNIHDLVIRQMTPPEATGQNGIRQIKIMAIQYVPEPQKMQSSTKKTRGTGTDRTVQAEKILGAKRAGNKRPNNAPKPPSVASVGPTVKDL
jgi:hypothetical protein